MPKHNRCHFVDQLATSYRELSTTPCVKEAGCALCLLDEAARFAIREAMQTIRSTIAQPGTDSADRRRPAQNFEHHARAPQKNHVEFRSRRPSCLYSRIHGQRRKARLLLLMDRPPLDHGLSDLVPQWRRKVGHGDPEHVTIAAGVEEPLRRPQIKPKLPAWRNGNPAFLRSPHKSAAICLVCFSSSIRFGASVT